MSKYSNVLVFSIALLLLHPVPVMAAGPAPGPALKNPTISGGTITAADVSGANLAANNVTQTASAWMGYLSGTADPYPINLSNSLTVHLPSGSYIYATPMPSATNPATLTNISGIGQSNFLTIWTPAFSGGSPGAVASNDQHQTVIYGAPNSYIWNGLDQLNFAGTGGTGQHVARYAQTLRTTYASGGAAHNPELWAGVGEYRDWTGQKSSLTGAGLAWEFDNFGNNVDDAHNRQGIVVVVGNAINPGVAIPNEVNTAISVYTAPYAQAKSMVALGGNYQTAAIDTRYAVGNGTAGAGPAAPTVTTSSSGVSVAVSNVMPFTSDFRGRDVNNGYPATIKIGNGQYTETAYAFAGAGPGGTLTLAAPASVTAGQSVVNGSRTYWLADGQQMAFDTAGLHYEYYDPLTGSIRYHGANNQNDAPVGIPMNVGWVIALSASYTLPAYVAGDFIALTGTVGGTLTLPAASSVQAGTGYPIANEGSADWTIALSGSDTAGTLYGNTTIRPIDRLLIVSDGAGAWHLVYRSNSEAPRFNGGITAASYNAGSTPGVSCSAGTVSLSTMVVTNGLVTHC